MEEYEQERERIRRRESKELIARKRQAQKGLKVLGFDPSEAKLEDKFGESRETLRHRMSPTVMLQRYCNCSLLVDHVRSGDRLYYTLGWFALLAVLGLVGYYFAQQETNRNLLL